MLSFLWLVKSEHWALCHTYAPGLGASQTSGHGFVRQTGSGKNKCITGRTGCGKPEVLNLQSHAWQETTFASPGRDGCNRLTPIVFEGADEIGR